jgi:hypothetical protein
MYQLVSTAIVALKTLSPSATSDSLWQYYIYMQKMESKNKEAANERADDIGRRA